MRVLPEGLAEKLASGVTTLAYLWRIVRRDGEAFGFTDHDRDLIVDDLIYAATGFTAGVIEKSLGLSIDSAAIEGALSADVVDAGDLARGLWDGARVDVWRVDWSDVALKVHLFAGRLGEVQRGENGFSAELRGLQAPLNAPVGRVFSRFCDAEVGDARCGLNLSDPDWRGEGVVTQVIDSSSFRASGLDAFADGLFSRGLLTWETDAVSEVSVHRLDGDDVILELTKATPVEMGAAFIVTAGCDKRLATCRGRFSNTINFRGFPHMPGNDAVQSGPVPGDAKDGSSRWTGS